MIFSCLASHIFPYWNPYLSSMHRRVSAECYAVTVLQLSEMVFLYPNSTLYLYIFINIYKYNYYFVFRTIFFGTVTLQHCNALCAILPCYFVISLMSEILSPLRLYKGLQVGLCIFLLYSLPQLLSSQASNWPCIWQTTSLSRKCGSSAGWWMKHLTAWA